MGNLERKHILKLEVEQDWLERYGTPSPSDLWRSLVVRNAMKEAIAQQEECDNDDPDYGWLVEKVHDALVKQMLQERQVGIEGEQGLGAQFEENNYAETLTPRQQRRFHSHSRGPDCHAVSDISHSHQEEACCQALSEFVCRYMSRNTSVRLFREECLKGELVNEDEAWHLLTSSLWKVLTMEDIQELGLCPLRASGRFVGEEGLLGMPPEMPILRSWVYTQMLTASMMSGLRRLDLDISLQSGEVIRKEYHQSSNNYVCITDQYAAVTQTATPFAFSVTANFFNAEQRIQPSGVPYFADLAKENHFEIHFVEGFYDLTGRETSLNGAAIEACRNLQRQYPIDAWDALRFLLTGIPPRMRPILAQNNAYVEWDCDVDDPYDEENIIFAADGPTSLLVQPWVTPESIADFWRSTRPQPAARVLPREDNLALFRFVLQHTPVDEPFRWERLCQAWNSLHGVNMDRGSFSKAFHRVRAALLPGYLKAE